MLQVWRLLIKKRGLSWSLTSPQWRSSSPARAATSSRSPPSWATGESQEPDWGLAPVPSHHWAPSAFWPYPGSVPVWELWVAGRRGCAARSPVGGGWQWSGGSVCKGHPPALAWQRSLSSSANGDKDQIWCSNSGKDILQQFYFPSPQN